MREVLSLELPIDFNKIITNRRLNIHITYAAFTLSTLPRAFLLCEIMKYCLISSTIKLEHVLSNTVMSQTVLTSRTKPIIFLFTLQYVIYCQNPVA